VENKKAANNPTKIIQSNLNVKVNKYVGGIICLHEGLASGELNGKKYQLLKTGSSIIFRYNGDDISLFLRDFVEAIAEDLLKEDPKEWKETHQGQCDSCHDPEISDEKGGPLNVHDLCQACFEG
jgi:hypothetical protein